MILVKELTIWKGSISPNHTYLLSDNMDKLFGYFKWNDPKSFQMLTPQRFSTRYRKFVVLERNLKVAGEVSNKTHTVTGSRGDIYTIEETENGLSCSCDGFKYRGRCKHIMEIK